MVDSPTDGPEAPGAREVILLPVNLAGLADMVEKTGSNRYALQAVRLRADGRGGYTAEATDGIWYVRVVGSVADADTYPIPPALETAGLREDDKRASARKGARPLVKRMRKV